MEYISILAQAQKAAGLGQLESFMDFVARAAQVKEEALDKIDIDHTIDDYAEMIGTSVDNVVPEDKVVEIRQLRAEQRQAEAQKQQQMQEAEIANKLAKSPLGGGGPGTAPTNALDAALAQAGAGFQELA